jgi:hypothetical protein
VPPVAISVIVPTRDRAELLETCLAGLSDTRFPGTREIIIVDNDSREPRTRALLERWTASGARANVAQPGPFNFATLANAGVAAAQRGIDLPAQQRHRDRAPDWLEQMAMLAMRDDVGAVGARLLYPDGAIQHAGVALGIGGAAGHVDKGALPVPGAFAPWHDETRTVSAVTAACLLVAGRIPRRRWHGRFFRRSISTTSISACGLPPAAGDRLLREATLIHHESRSRGTTHHGADLTLRAGTRYVARPLGHGSGDRSAP